MNKVREIHQNDIKDQNCNRGLLMYYILFFVYKTPKDIIVRNNPQYPIPVKIDYTIDATDCGNNYLDIVSIKRRQNIFTNYR